MPDLTNFAAAGNRLSFQIDGEEFTVKWPDEYRWGREHEGLLKDIALCAWANKLAFTLDEENYVDFEASEEQIGFWKWIAHRVHVLDAYQSGQVEPTDIRDLNVETGSDTASLVPTSTPEVDGNGALICQSTGKESVASKLILEDQDVGPIYSMFFEYPSRAATHKITGREEFEDYFDNPTLRVWSDVNTLQSTLEPLSDNFEPVTCFWEMMYATIALPMMVEHDLKWLLMGNQLDTGEAFPYDDQDHVAFAEINQSYLFEIAYSDYLSTEYDIPVTHTSNVRQFTGFTSRLIVGEREPDFLQYMQNCLRPKPANRWCLRCYKCNNSWIEFMACGFDPSEAGLSHDVLVENPHFGADRDDYGFSFPRYERDELVWREFGAKQYFEKHIASELTDEQWDAFETWRERQEERLDWDYYHEIREYQGKYVEPVTNVIPDEVLSDMGRESTDYVPERMDPELWSGYASEWNTFIN